MIPIIFGSLDFQLGNPNRWKIYRGQKYAHIHLLNTKTRLTMLFWSGFGLYSRWVPLKNAYIFKNTAVCVPYRTVPYKTSDCFARHFSRFVSKRRRQVVIEQTQFLSIFLCIESKLENIFSGVNFCVWISIFFYL